MKTDISKEETDKNLLRMEVVIGISTLIIYLVLVTTISYFLIEEYIKIILITLLTLYLIVIASIMLKIEQIAGYYKCMNCNNKHVPTYLNVFLAMHIGRTRYMKCHKCNKYSWQRKVIK